MWNCFKIFRVSAVCAGLVMLSATSGVRAAETSELLAQCAACHGPDGIARSADVPNLAGQHELYLYNQLKAFAAGKRPHREMRYMSRQLTDADMHAIAQYYERLPR